MSRNGLNSRRPGFSLLETLVVLTLFSIVGSFALPVMQRSMAQLRLKRAATVVMSNLQLAQSLAARQRVPVRLSIDSAAKVLTVRSYRDASVVYAQQRFDATSQMAVQRLEVSDTSLVLYPSGVADRQLDITLREADRSRRVRMTPAGQIWMVR